MQFNGNLSFVAVPNLPNFGKVRIFFVFLKKRASPKDRAFNYSWSF